MRTQAPDGSSRLALLVVSLWLGLALLVGCASEPMRTRTYAAKSAQPPAIKYCCDATGHKPGARPFIFGGTCCCTPTAKLLKRYQKDGYLKGWTVGALQAAYSERGIKTDLDHRGCNNMCAFGPHVVKGGHCMATPTPGTLNYEEVIFGRFALCKPNGAKHKENETHEK